MLGAAPLSSKDNIFLSISNLGEGDEAGFDLRDEIVYLLLGQGWRRDGFVLLALDLGLSRHGRHLGFGISPPTGGLGDRHGW